ncbi:MAG: hypothetical protein IJC74_08155 [Clostridia bacterium]|nr:hypothetical protein [Clostridia bacterium]
MSRATMKEIYKRKDKDGLIRFCKEKFESDLEYVSNSYKRALDDYNKKVADGSNPMMLIPKSLLDAHAEAIAEYKRQVTSFSLKLYDIPEKNFVGNIICCLFFSFAAYNVGGAAILWSIIFGAIAVLNILLIIRKLVKLYGNEYFDMLDNMYEKIDTEYYHKIQVASNRIEQAITKLMIEKLSHTSR